MVGVIHLFRRLRHLLRLSHARNTRVADATEAAGGAVSLVRFCGNVGSRERLGTFANVETLRGERPRADCRARVRAAGLATCAHSSPSHSALSFATAIGLIAAIPATIFYNKFIFRGEPAGATPRRVC